MAEPVTICLRCDALSVPVKASPAPALSVHARDSYIASTKSSRLSQPDRAGASRQLLGADPGKRARSFLVDLEVPLDTSAQLEPDDRHLQALAADATRPGQLANVLRAPPRQRFVHEFSVFEQTHTPKDKRRAESLCSKWIIFRRG